MQTRYLTPVTSEYTQPDIARVVYSLVSPLLVKEREMVVGQPNVKHKACAPGSRNSISKSRSAMGLVCRIS